MSEFVNTAPTLDAYWRSIILFGRNSASYKFAIAKPLLEIADSDQTLVTLDQLAEPFLRHLTDHLNDAHRQGTSASSRFLDSCRSFNEGATTNDQLIEKTVELGFANVIGCESC